MTNPVEVANDIKAAILELADGRDYPDLLEAIDSLAALATPPAPSVQADERTRLRAEQAAAVMPQIGPLLDAWEGADNDTKATIKQEAPDLSRALQSIGHAMEGAPSVQASQAVPSDEGQVTTGALLMGLAVIRELTGTQQGSLDATIDAVRAALAPPAAQPVAQTGSAS